MVLSKITNGSSPVRISLLALVVWLLTPLNPPAAAESLVVGILTELSGPAAESGFNCRLGHEMAYRAWTTDGSVKSRPVRIVWGDTQGIARTGVTEFKRIVEVERAQVVIVNRSQVGMALNPLARKQRIPLLGVVGHPDFVKDNDYAYRFWPPT